MTALTNLDVLVAARGDAPTCPLPSDAPGRFLTIGDTVGYSSKNELVAVTR